MTNADIEALKGALDQVKRERDSLITQLAQARGQNEHMLATIRQLYEEVRSEQLGYPIERHAEIVRGCERS